jgi:hypothetical protein
LGFCFSLGLGIEFFEFLVIAFVDVELFEFWVIAFVSLELFELWVFAFVGFEFLEFGILAFYYIRLCAGARGNPLVLGLRILRVLPICCARVVK